MLWSSTVCSVINLYNIQTFVIHYIHISCVVSSNTPYSTVCVWQNIIEENIVPLFNIIKTYKNKLHYVLFSQGMLSLLRDVYGCVYMNVCVCLKRGVKEPAACIL